MKKLLSISAFAAFAALSAPFTMAQTLATGQSGLIVGFDFANAGNTIPSSGGTSFVGLYSDVGTGDDSNPGAFVPRGTLFINGSNGSDVWNRYTSGTGANVSGTDLTSNLSIDSALGSRGPGGKGFNGQSLGELGGETTGNKPNQLALRPNSGTGLDTIAFQIDATSFSSLSLQYSARIGSNTGSVLWSYSPTGLSGSFTTIGSATALSTTDTLYSLSLPAAADNSIGYFAATFTTTGTNTQIGLDNFEFLGTFAGTVIPEPSTYAAILGLLSVGVVAFRRRFNRI